MILLTQVYTVNIHSVSSHLLCEINAHPDAMGSLVPRLWLWKKMREILELFTGIVEHKVYKELCCSVTLLVCCTCIRGIKYQNLASAMCSSNRTHVAQYRID